jgi:hypothetical protein
LLERVHPPTPLLARCRLGACSDAKAGAGGLEGRGVGRATGRGIAMRFDPIFSAPHINDRPDLALKGRVVTKPLDEIELFRRHLKFLRERREDAVAQIAASRELIEQSRALIVQIDEQINQIGGELGGTAAI